MRRILVLLFLIAFQVSCALDAKLTKELSNDATSGGQPPTGDTTPVVPELSYPKSTIVFEPDVASLPPSGKITVKYCLKDQFGNPFEKSDLDFSFNVQGVSSGVSFSNLIYNSVDNCFQADLDVSASVGSIGEIVPQVNSAPVASVAPKAIEVVAPRLDFTGNSHPSAPIDSRIANETAPFHLTGNCDPVLGDVHVNGGIDAEVLTPCNSDGTFGLDISTIGSGSPYFKIAADLDPIIMIKQGSGQPKITRIYRGHTSVTPIFISTPAELQAMTSSGSNSNKYYFLTQDIDLSSVGPTNNFTPIGNSSANYWSGRLFGDGRKILNLHIGGASSNYKALLGYANWGYAYDLHFENATIASVNAYGGVLAGEWRNSIARRVSINGSTISGGGYLGLLAGRSWDGIVRDSWTSGAVNGTSMGVGGIIGNSWGADIYDSWSDATVSTNDQYAGGISGQVDIAFDVVIENTFALGNISGTEGVGGLLGFVYNSNPSFTSVAVSKSFSIGNVNATTAPSIATLYSGGAIGSMGTVTTPGTGVTLSEIYYKSRINCSNCTSNPSYATADSALNMLDRVQTQWDFNWKWKIHSSGTRPDLITNPRP